VRTNPSRKRFLSLSGSTSINKRGILQTEPREREREREWWVKWIRQDEEWKKIKRKNEKAKE
jgi:hypothetical protein